MSLFMKIVIGLRGLETSESDDRFFILWVKEINEYVVKSIAHAKKSKGAPHATHHAVEEIRLQELVRAGTGNDCDTVLTAHPHRLG